MRAFRAEAWLDAKTAFAAAIDGRLRTGNDRALTLGMLAATDLEIGDRESAAAHLQLARTLAAKSQVSQFLASLEDKARVVV